MSEAIPCELVVEQDEEDASTADDERSLLENVEERKCSRKACLHVGDFEATVTIIMTWRFHGKQSEDVVNNLELLVWRGFKSFKILPCAGREI